MKWQNMLLLMLDNHLKEKDISSYAIIGFLVPQTCTKK